MKQSSLINTALRVNVNKLPFPLPLAPGESSRAYTCRLTPQERKVLRRYRKPLPSKWAAKHRIITKGPGAGSPLNLSLTPHMVGIMDASFLPFVREIGICAVAQSAKTTCVDTCLAYAFRFEPGDALSVYPDENTAKENNAERIQPMLRRSPQLRRLLTGRKEDISQSLIRLMTMTYYMGWAGSPISLSNRSIKFLDLQEVNKYKESPNRQESGTMELARIRVRVFEHTHKIWISSSPTIESGNISVFIEKEAEAVFIYMVRCPYCGHEQHMDFTRESFTWPHDETGHSIDRKLILNRKLARYICQNDHCARHWDDNDRNQAIQTMIWRHRRLHTDPDSKKTKIVPGEELFRYCRTHRPRSIGFIVPSWISRFVSLSEAAHDFLKISDKNLSPEEQSTARKNFENKHRAGPWRIILQERPVDAIMDLRDERPEGLVPGNQQVAALLAGIDTHSDEKQLMYLIVAFGYGRLNEQWLIRHGSADSFVALAEVLWTHEYADAQGNRYPVILSIQDAMGDRTREVYEFCADHRGRIFPSKGRDTMDTAFRFSTKEYYPGTKTPIPDGGVQLMNINTKYYKDNLAAKLNVSPGTPGGIHLHAESDKDFARHFVSEERSDKGIWQQIRSRPNHYWDCLVGANAGADYLGVRYWPRAEDLDQEEPEEQGAIIET
jgi:phage terminase large subunit GpA-like protein